MLEEALSDHPAVPITSAFVFIDEHADTIVNAQFGNPVQMPGLSQLWWDMPSDRHSQGANLSFVDGHVERWKWRYPKVFIKFAQPPSLGETPTDYVTRAEWHEKIWPISRRR